MSNTSGNIIGKGVPDIQGYSGVSIPDFKTNEKVMGIGPLESVFPCSASKILDFMITFRSYDYSISDIARKSGVGFKTTLKEVNKLAAENVIFKNRNVGKAMLFKINPDSSKSKYLEKLSSSIATERAMKITEQEMTTVM